MIWVAVAGVVLFGLLVWVALRSARSGLPGRPASREAKAIEEAGIDASRARSEMERTLAAAHTEIGRQAEEARHEMESASARARVETDEARSSAIAEMESAESERDRLLRKIVVQKLVDVLAAIRETGR